METERKNHAMDAGVDIVDVLESFHKYTSNKDKPLYETLQPSEVVNIKELLAQDVFNET